MVYTRQFATDPKPETGLAEWTSKIKALQQQVDADEEAEQRSLEEEIAASRLARLRRNNRSAASLNTPQDAGSPTSPAANTTPRKGPGYDSVEKVARSRSPLQRAVEAPALVPQSPKSFPAEKSNNIDKQPISLAAFIGGRATGPRLNKHAPQQDVPFEQVASHRSVHPVFGAGGVAMPGMASLPSKSPGFTKPTPNNPYIPPSNSRTERIPTPKYVTQRSISPDKPSVRERTVTLPASTTPQIKVASLSPITSVSSAKKLFEMDVPKEDRARSVSLVPKIIDRAPTAETSPSFSKSPVENDFLLRPTSAGRNANTPASQRSQNRITTAPSLSPPPQKELTPSISRLQGRGFVQNMVKKSTQLEKAPETLEDSPRGVKPTGRGGTVLERWKPASANETVSAPLQPPPKPPVLNPTKNNLPSPVSKDSTSGLKAIIAPLAPSLMPAISLKPTSTQNPSAPKLGSATTMHVYKPPLTPPPAVVEELGFGESLNAKDSAVSSFPTSPLKPLHHPTKDRAKVARKRKPTAQTVQPHTVTSTVTTSPTPAESKETALPQRPSPSPGPANVTPSFADRMAAFQLEQPKKSESVAPHGHPKTRPIQEQPKPLFEIDREPMLDEQLAQPGGPSYVEHPMFSRPMPMEVPPNVPVQGRPRARSPQNLPKPPAVDSGTGEKDRCTSRRVKIEGPAHEKRRSRTKSIKLEDLAQPKVPIQEADAAIPESVLRSIVARSENNSIGSSHQAISLEVMSIIGTTATLLPQLQNSLFHDTEILAVVHRCKANSDGLVSTAVWGWEGKRAKLGEREQKKLQELGKRYGTAVNMVQQYSEPRELVEVLGGTFAIRQGPRNRWSIENAAMHSVRSLNGAIYIDETELNIEHLCSAFSYCVTFMDAVYVWHGRGATKAERQAALKHAESLNTSTAPAELEEGQDDNELFWVILGNEDYSDADYWRWRPTVTDSDPRAWRVDATSKELVTRIEHMGSETTPSQSVYIIDCFWEFYVLVGAESWHRRKDISLALKLTTEIATRVSTQRPYKPTTHAIFLPSRIPRDLRVNLRGLDEFSINTGILPDHMNVFPASDILRHYGGGF